MKEMKTQSIMIFTEKTNAESGIDLIMPIRRIRLITMFFLISIYTGLNLNTLYGQVSWNTGNGKNWEELIPKLLYDSESGIFYYIQNSDENIHVNLRFMDETLQKKVLMFGLQIYIDPKNKKNKDLSIKYPAGSGDPQNQQGSKTRMNMSFNELKSLATEPLQEIECKGYLGKKEISYSYAENQEGIHGKIDFDPIGSMFYELVIPVKEVPGLQEGEENPFSIGIETGHLTMSSAPSAGRGGGRPGAGGRPGGGRGSGSRESGIRQNSPSIDMEKMTQPDKLWLKDQKIYINKTDKK